MHVSLYCSPRNAAAVRLEVKPFLLRRRLQLLLDLLKAGPLRRVVMPAPLNQSVELAVRLG